MSRLSDNARPRYVMDAQVSEDGEYVRRTTPIADADVTLARTVYARPLQVGRVEARQGRGLLQNRLASGLLALRFAQLCLRG